MPAPTRERTNERLQHIRSQFSGRMGIAARNLSTGEEFLLDHEEVFPTASTIKTAILYELYRQIDEGTHRLDDRVDLKTSDIVEGSGVLRDIMPGLQPTVHDLAMLMIIVSDNTATNMLIDLVGGPGSVNASMKAIGLDGTTLYRKINFTLKVTDPQWLATSTPFDLMRLAGMIGAGEAVSSEASAGMLAILKRQHYTAQFPRFLGSNVYSAELGETQHFWTANKTGGVTGVRADMGVISIPGGQIIAYGVMTDGSKDGGFTAETEGEVANGRAGRVIMEYFWPEGFEQGLIGIESPFMAGF
ncbi:MAG: serine hydrolase [Thermomicrobiales bacterium]|nr:serine hydrolase [Thermomicrobiales bacterium]